MTGIVMMTGETATGVEKGIEEMVEEMIEGETSVNHLVEIEETKDGKKIQNILPVNPPKSRTAILLQLHNHHHPLVCSM